MNAFNIIHQPVKAGAHTDVGSLTRELSPEAQGILQGIVNEHYARFCSVVRRQRPGVDCSKSTFDGRVFSAGQALQRGLVDRIGYLEDALAAAREMAGQPQAGAVILHRQGDTARTPFATTPNIPLQASLFPLSLPGLERSKLPTFLYLWQPDPTLERLSGK
jgi:protease-4